MVNFPALHICVGFLSALKSDTIGRYDVWEIIPHTIHPYHYSLKVEVFRKTACLWFNMIVYHFYRQLESNLKRIHEAFRRRKLLLPLGSALMLTANVASTQWWEPRRDLLACCHHFSPLWMSSSVTSPPDTSVSLFQRWPPPVPAGF